MRCNVEQATSQFENLKLFERANGTLAEDADLSWRESLRLLSISSGPSTWHACESELDFRLSLIVVIPLFLSTHRTVLGILILKPSSNKAWTRLISYSLLSFSTPLLQISKCRNSFDLATTSCHHRSLVLADNPPSMDDSRNPPKDPQCDVDEDVGAAAGLHCDGNGRNEEGEEVEADIARGGRHSRFIVAVCARCQIMPKRCLQSRNAYLSVLSVESMCLQFGCGERWWLG